MMEPIYYEHSKTGTLNFLRGETVELVDIEAGDTSDVNFGMAVDLGTTTLVAHLVDLCSGETVSTQAKYNSQAPFGEDVISRIMCAADPARSEGLKELVVDDINDLLSALLMEAGAKPHDVTYVICAGNTVMTHLLLGLDPSSIRRDPYIPAVSEAPVIRAAEIGVGINPRGLLATLPCVSSYVGGDTWMISPEVAGNQSENNATQPRAIGSESVTSHPSGARPSQLSSKILNPGIDFAAIVFTGPPAIRFERMPRGPSSLAR